MKKAVVLLSGGLDSATTLAIAIDRGFECHALSFHYGQRHKLELDAAQRLATAMNVKDHRILTIDLGQLGGSALTDNLIDIPDTPGDGIPVTYVPARNTIFLAYALAYAEILGACDIFIGVNAVDYSGYPDCRPEFIESFTHTANLATRAGTEGSHYAIHTPLIDMSKAEIITTGTSLGVNYALTLSCYQPTGDGSACGTCDSCRFRRAGFVQAGIPDPTNYARL